MRFSEIILSESVLRSASPSSWPHYLEKLIDSTSIGIGEQGEKASGLELSPKSKKDIAAILKKLPSDWASLSTADTDFLKEFPVTFTNGATYPLKAIHKSTELKSGSAETGTEKKPWNEGELSETLLGAALFARFTSNKNISADDVWKSLKLFTANVVPGGFEITNVKRKKSPIRMVALNKPLNNKAIDDLIHKKAELEKHFPKSVKALENKIKACAAYANESVKVKSALQEADENPGAPINIKTDGVGDQRGTKADLQIEIGKWKQLLSLKVNDVKQFGQNSGSSGAIVTEFFQRFIPDLDLSSLYMRNGRPIPWTPETGKGWPEVDNVKATNQLKRDGLWDAAVDQVFKLTGMAYKKAALHLQNKLSTEEGAAEVVTNFHEGILHHVQGNAQFQTLVILNPSAKVAWKELEFGASLEDALRNYKLAVEVDVAEGRGGNHKLRIYGTPITPEARIAAHSKVNTTSKAKKVLQQANAGKAPAFSGKEMLFQLRSYLQAAGNMRNPVEMGPLLKDLTEVQKVVDLPEPSTVEKDQDAEQAAQQQQPQVQQEPTQAQQPVAEPVSQEPVQQQAGVPSGATAVPNPYEMPGNDFGDADELARVRKNAGIVVE